MTDAVPQRPMEPIVIEGAKALLPGEGMVETTVRIENGVLAEVGGTSDIKGAIRIDGRGHHLLPGVVDLHGDAFERQIMPRPGVHFPIAVALEDTDRQLVANGITTAYHAVTYSWEPGLRSRGSVVEIIDGLRAGRDRLLCDTRLHIRQETFNLDAEEEITGWIADGDVHLLAFNDHTPDIFGKIQKGAPLGTYLDRTGLDHDGFKAKVETVAARADEVPASIARLAEAGKKAGIPMASHDDDYGRAAAVLRRARLRHRGVSDEPGDQPRQPEMGSIAVFGAPNILRGGSHLKAGGCGPPTRCGKGSARPSSPTTTIRPWSSPPMCSPPRGMRRSRRHGLWSRRRPRGPPASPTGGDRGRPACGSGAGRTRRSERRPRQARPDRGDAGGRADRPPGHS